MVTSKKTVRRKKPMAGVVTKAARKSVATLKRKLKTATKKLSKVSKTVKRKKRKPAAK